MNTSGILSAAAATLAAVVLVVGAAVWVGGSRPASGLNLTAMVGDPTKLPELLAAHWRNRGHGGRWRGSHGAGNRHGGCAGAGASDHAALTDFMMSAARGYLRITPAQDGEWRALTKVIRAEAATLAAACDKWAAASNDTVAKRLALAEDSLRLSADALARLRPAIDALYRELDPTQKRLFDRALRHTSLGGRSFERRR